MYVKEVLVQNKAGLHARPATFFIQQSLTQREKQDPQLLQFRQNRQQLP